MKIVFLVIAELMIFAAGILFGIGFVKWRSYIHDENHQSEWMHDD